MSDKKSPLEQALDLLFYAPIGLVLGAEEVIPQLIERGRQQVSIAKMFGQFAVQQGQKEAGKAVAKAQEQTTAALGQLGARTATTRPGAAGQAARPSTQAPARPRAATRPAGATADGNADGEGTPSADLAIPDYDSLSASQVVPRLAGLSRAELEAVRAYESAGRGRKTILNKVAQLQS